MVAQLLLGLSILVGLHEAGHMLAAKMFGMRVEKFSIGFPPKLFGFKKGETEYSLGAIPLGGFVKISGMIDESLDTQSMGQEPQPWEFRAKPAWQRLIVMMGGIIVNVITGIIIFICLLYVYGQQYYRMEDVNQRGIVAYELAQEIGLKTGDKIISVNGRPVEKFNEVTSPDVLLGSNSFYVIERNGEQIRIDIPNDFVGDLTEKDGEFIDPIYPFKVGKIKEGDNADKAGLKEGDSIISVNGRSISHFHELGEVLKSNKGKQVSMIVERSGEQVQLTPQVDTTGKIGFYPDLLLKHSVETFGVGESVVKGTEMAFSVIINNIKGLGKIFRGELNASKSISGPIGIAQQFGTVWIWQKFWSLVGLLSMVLAFMNFLPIPALDGGHVMFLTYEIVSGRKPSDKFLEGAQKVGMVILLALMVFAFGNDIFKTWFK